jgi:glycosyltransferase involved in cell wall biosynthesis
VRPGKTHQRFVTVTVFSHHRFVFTPDGRVWTPNLYPYSFWERYLAVFDKVRIAARAHGVAAPPSGALMVSGASVELDPLPYFVGPWQYAVRRYSLSRAVLRALTRDSAVILRVGSQLAGLAVPSLVKANRPFGLEVVGDPYDEFGPEATSSRLRPLLRWWLSRQLRRQCSQASACAYVTESALQARYPASAAAFQTHYSSIDLLDAHICRSPRSYTTSRELLKLITVASMAHMYKGVDVLLEALRRCTAGGARLSLTVIGGGRHLPEMRQLARTLGVADRCCFTGELSNSDDIRERLDATDLFVLPSRQEGLPRAMIEAMARGLPCIGTAVGGIPELLGADEMAAPGDAAALAAAITALARDPERLTNLSYRNLTIARRYEQGQIAQRREALYQAIRHATECWLDAKRRATSPQVGQFNLRETR